jgi:single-strand DNA-binding protein
MSYEIQGRIHKLYEPERKSDKFLTQELVLLLDGRYPEYPKFQFTNDHANNLQHFAEGDEVRITFELKGREWQGKYFTNLNGWRIEKVGATAVPTAPAPTVAAQDEQGEPANIGAEDEGELPF